MRRNLYYFIKWLYKRYIDELYIPSPASRKIEATCCEGGYQINSAKNKIIISASRPLRKGKHLIPNSHEVYLIDPYETVVLVKKVTN